MLLAVAALTARAQSLTLGFLFTGFSLAEFRILSVDNIKVVLCCLALELGYVPPSSIPKHVYLKISSKISVPCQLGHQMVTEKGKKNETKT